MDQFCTGLLKKLHQNIHCPPVYSHMAHVSLFVSRVCVRLCIFSESEVWLWTTNFPQIIPAANFLPLLLVAQSYALLLLHFLSNHLATAVLPFCVCVTQKGHESAIIHKRLFHFNYNVVLSNEMASFSEGLLFFLPLSIKCLRKAIREHVNDIIAC